jgi:uncharacterized protein
MEKVRCPLCKGWASWKDNPHRPFCSDQCRQRDLGNWATEKYRVAAHDDEVGESEAESKKGEQKKKEES